MEGAMSKMKKLTVIGKATIKDISVIKKWFESKEAKHWLDENWAPTAPGELYRNVDAEFLKNKLTYIQRRERELSKIALWKRRLKDAKTARKNDNK